MSRATKEALLIGLHYVVLPSWLFLCLREEVA
jgi:hypothetical protein